MSDDGDELPELGFRIVYTGDPDEIDDWLFTFGFDHEHPELGIPLRNFYVAINGTWRSARLRMVEMFGVKWAHQYPSAMREKLEQRYFTLALDESLWPGPKEQPR